MDILAHALYGVTVCSRAGLAGGREGTRGARLWREPTAWWALAFGLLPDVVSMLIPFLLHAVSGADGNFFRHFDGGWLTVYRVMHSLVLSLAVAGLLRAWRPRLFAASLAWPLHVAMDAVSHNDGKFQTLLFYPFSDWGINGIAWWQHREFFFGYWIVLAATWAALFAWRRRATAPSGV